SSVIVDSTRPVSAGFQASGIWASDHSGFDMRLALAAPLSTAVAVGVSGRYVSLTPEAQDQPDLVHGITFDGSIRVTPTQGLHIAAFGYNVLNLHSDYAPRMAGGSVSLQIGD